MDSADKKAKFALAILHKTLPHFDSGGTVNALSAPANQLSGPSASQSGPTNSGANPLIGMTNLVTNPIAAAGLQGGPNSFMSQISPYLNPVGALLGGSQNNFQAQGANLQAGTNAGQLNQAYNSAQSGLNNQQNFVGALQGQNGVANQNANYSQLGQIASGQGPNPAQAMLNQATGQNVANQAALMAGQRGSGANAGMIARQAAQQGANTQQQAAGQAATNQANQSLAAINAQTGVAQNQVNQLGQGITGYNNAAQNEQNILQQANTAYNNANVGMTSNMNNVNAGVAAGNAANKQGILGGVMNAVGSLFADGGEVEADLGKSDFNTTPAASGPAIDPSTPAAAPAGGGKSGGGGAGLIGGLMALLADGGPVKANVNGPQSAFAKTLNAMNSGMSSGQPSSNANYQAGMQEGQGMMNLIGKGMSALNSDEESMPTPGNSSNTANNNDYSMMAAEGGKVPAMVSPGEKYLSPKEVKKVEKGANPMEVGEKIPGKPKVSGAKNDYSNDTVPKTLDEGGIVLPRSVTQSKNPHWAAHKFVSEIMAKQGKSMPKKPSK